LVGGGAGGVLLTAVEYYPVVELIAMINASQHDGLALLFFVQANALRI
jgi:hypothetical protein